MKRVLFVTKDKRSGMIATALAKELIRLGCEEPTIVAESLSLAEWDKAGRAVDHRGPPVFDSKNLWQIDAGKIIDKENPGVVIVGLGSPINLEARFMAEARSRNIPVVAIDDNWHAFARSPVAADLYLTIDELGKRLIGQSTFYSVADVHVMGDIALNPPKMPDPFEDFIGSLLRVKALGPVVVLATQKWGESGDIIRLALESLEISRRRVQFTVIPRIHPGASSDDKKSWEQLIDSYASKMHGSIMWLQDVGGLKWDTDRLTALADVTIAATGSGLRIAAYNGKIPVCVATPALCKKLALEQGGEQLHPLIALEPHAGIELSEPCDLFAEVEAKQDLIREGQRQLLTPTPFDPARAALEIELFL